MRVVTRHNNTSAPVCNGHPIFYCVRLHVFGFVPLKMYEHVDKCGAKRMLTHTDHTHIKDVKQRILGSFVNTEVKLGRKSLQVVAASAAQLCSHQFHPNIAY